MEILPLHVVLDVGCRQHRAAIGSPQGHVFAEFDVAHTPAGFAEFFRRIEEHREGQQPVWVAMEGCNGYARPLDAQVRAHGYRLLNVNNLKLARFKEMFPGPAKTDALDTHRMLELLRMRAHVPLAKGILQEVGAVPPANAQLKRLTRRRRQLVSEKVRVVNRMQADLHAVCPGLVAITASVDSRWFLGLLSCRNDLSQIATLRLTTLRHDPPGGGQACGHQRAVAAPSSFRCRCGVGGTDDRCRCPTYSERFGNAAEPAPDDML